MGLSQEKFRLGSVLACPRCGGELRERENVEFYCLPCRRQYFIENGIPRFSQPPNEKREYIFEVERYNKIAKSIRENPKKFKEWGLDKSYPETRNKILRGYLEGQDSYLNIGMGFGQLEKVNPEKTKVCLDQSFEFLLHCKEQNIPKTWYVEGFAEQMPFQDESFSCIISDCVFQTVTDQKEFLYECARVLKQGGKLIFTIAWNWNYPRKPQTFSLTEQSLLRRFLGELGILLNAESHTLDVDGCVGDYIVFWGEKK